MTAAARAAPARSREDDNAAYLKDVFTAIGRRLEALADETAGKKGALPHGWLDVDADAEPPALVALRAAFGLSLFETAVLALCAAHELDGAISPLCARAMGDPGRPWPTFALALRAFEPGSWDAVSAEGPLRRWRLIEVERVPGQPLVQTPIRCDERILDFIKGLNQLDERLSPSLTPFQPSGREGDPVAATALARVWSGDSATSPVMLYGAEASTRLDTAAAAARASGRQLFRMEAAALAAAPSDLDQLAKLWRREAALLPLALLIETGSEDAPGEAILRRFAAKAGVALAVGADRLAPRQIEGFLSVAATSPPSAAQEAGWSAALGRGHTEIARHLAETFDFSLESIRRIAAVTAADGDDAVWRGCTTAVRPRLDGLAQRIEPRATWADLVVPDAQRAMLRQIADQVRLRRRVYDDWGYRARLSRGLGVNALFAGESGTGKTMAAEVLAADLGVNLYRIDLSSVVSKYIGETEKNLRQLFDAAERGGAMLLFDEADALFGKRSDVKDSHDRYANIEVNYLLQRIESFTGLAVLATNMKSALDTAFLRRLRFVVQFPYPGPIERAALWRGAFPGDVPREALRYDQLARLNLTGGNIVAAAINATFLAAGENAKVGMRHVLQAARAEMAKLNRPVNEGDFIVPVPTETPAGSGTLIAAAAGTA